MRTFRFGVNVRTAASAEEWAGKARQVERLGYSVLLVPDHLAELLAPFGAALQEVFGDFSHWSFPPRPTAVR